MFLASSQKRLPVGGALRRLAALGGLAGPRLVLGVARCVGCAVLGG